MRFLAAFMATVALCLAACQGTPPPASPATSTLIPVTETPLPTPQPTATLTSTPEANVLLASTLTAPTPTAPSFAPDDDLLSFDLDPVATELVQIAQRRLADMLDVPTRRVRLVAIETYQWTDSSLGCPVPGQTYFPVISDGYRIVLSVGDAAYYFHTDFDRALQCEAGFERLPEGTATPAPTPAPTLAEVG